MYIILIIFFHDIFCTCSFIFMTADMEKYECTTQSYYRGSSFVLLVYDSAEFSSLPNLQVIAEETTNYQPMSKLILVRNKTDLQIGPDGVTPEQEDGFIRKLKQNLFAKFSTSAKNNEGISEMLREVAKYALKLMEHTDYASDPFATHLDLVKPPYQGGCCG